MQASSTLLQVTLLLFIASMLHAAEGAYDTTKDEQTQSWKGKGAPRRRSNTNSPTSNQRKAPAPKAKTSSNYIKNDANRKLEAMRKREELESERRLSEATQKLSQLSERAIPRPNQQRSPPQPASRPTQIEDRMKHLHVTEKEIAMAVRDNARETRGMSHSAVEYLYANGKCSWKLCSGVTVSQSQVDYLQGVFAMKTTEDILSEFQDYSMREIKAIRIGMWPMDHRLKKCFNPNCPDRFIIGTIKNLGDDAMAIAKTYPDLCLKTIMENIRRIDGDSNEHDLDHGEHEKKRSPEEVERARILSDRVNGGFRDKYDIASFKKLKKTVEVQKKKVEEIEVGFAQAEATFEDDAYSV